MQKGVKESFRNAACNRQQKKSKYYNYLLSIWGKKWPSRLQRPQELVLPHQSRRQSENSNRRASN